MSEIRYAKGRFTGNIYIILGDTESSSFIKCILLKKNEKKKSYATYFNMYSVHRADVLEISEEEASKCLDDS